jgi:hypothetical protein
MYTLALFIVMAIVLEAVMTVLRSILDTVKVGDLVAKLPIIGANLTLLIAIVMVWIIGERAHLLNGWGWSDNDDWINTVVNGAIIAGMIPLKEAIFSAINKGLRP